MATTEEKIILTVDTSLSGKSIGELRTEYKALKQELEAMNATEEGYAQKLNQVKAAQYAMRDAMNYTAKDIASLKADTDIAGKSYNELQRTLTALTQAYKNTKDETERLNLANQILPIQKQLKDLDERIGNHQRNVGNYTQSIVQAFGSVGGAARGLVAPIGQVDMALKALSANPAMAAIGLLASAIALVAKNLKTSEDNMRAMSEAMSAFQAIGDITTRAMQSFGKALTVVVEQANKLIQKIFPKLREEAEARGKITQKENELLDARREALKRNAEDELKVAELRSKATQKSLYGAEQRIAFLKEATELEKAQMERNVQIAQQELEIAELESQRADDDTEAKNKKAQAYANVLKAQTEYFTGTRRLTSQLEAAIKEEQAANPLLKVQDELLKGINSSLEDINDELDKMIAQGIADEMKAEADAIADTDAELERRVAGIEKAMDYNLRFAKITGATEEEIYEITKNANDMKLALLEEYAERQMELGNPMRAVALRQEAADLEKEIELASLEETIRINEAKAKSDEQLFKTRLSLMQNYAGAVSGIMGSIADIMEANSQAEGKSAEAAKAVRIAAATIDTIAGAVGTYMQTVQTVPPPASIPLAIANAAVVTAAGMANIAKIKAQRIGGGTSAGGASFSGGATAPDVGLAVPQMAMVTGASNEAILNSMVRNQKVYILQSDLQAEGRRVTIQNNETTFK